MRSFSVLRNSISVRVLVAALLGGSVAALPTQASATTLPGNQLYYAFAVSNVYSGAPNSAEDYWGRVGQYTFNTDGTATESFWFWSQTNPLGHAIAADNSCPTGCHVLTPTNYQNGVVGYPRVLSGTWTQGVTGCPDLCISWYDPNSGTYSNETWQVTGSSSDLSKITLESSDYGAVTGWAFGGSYHAGFVMSAKYIHDNYPATYSGPYCEAANPNNGAGGNPDPYVACGTTSIPVGSFTACPNTNDCLSRVAACTCGGNDKYYLATSASAPGKVWYELYNIGNNTDYCPQTTQHEHVVALRQILGTSGHFYGFVGIEASLYPDGAPNNMLYLTIENETNGLPF